MGYDTPRGGIVPLFRVREDMTSSQLAKLHETFSFSSAGLLDDFLYEGEGGVKLFEAILKECPDYYPAREKGLMKRAGSNVGSIIQPPENLTMVARGSSTSFGDKEFEVASTLEKEHGHRIISVVHIDQSQAALDASVKLGLKLLPNAQHDAVKADMYSNNLKYPIRGDRELSVICGITLGNMEGTNDADYSDAPANLTRRLSAINRQMKINGRNVNTNEKTKSGILVATYDVSPVKAIEKAYTGKQHDAFAINGLKVLFNESSGVEKVFIPTRRFNSENHYFSRGVVILQDVDIQVEDQIYRLDKGEVVWTGNSVKLPEEIISAVHKIAGFEYEYPTRLSDVGDKGEYKVICPPVFSNSK